MAKVTLGQIAEVNKTSVTTVYNAINSCTPVDTKLKKEILITAESLGYFAQNKMPTCDIAVILPSCPMYFWSEAEKGILDEIRNTNVSLKLFTYNNMDDEEDFVLCINSAKRSNAKVYIITPTSTPGAVEALKGLDKEIIFLNEYVPVNNAGYVGSNGYGDGQALAKACSGYLKDHPRILIIDTNTKHYMANERKRGFCEALPDNARIAGEIRLDFNRILSANIAREIQNKYLGKFDCIFIAQGWFQHVFMALKKLKIVVPCVGFENQKISPKYTDNCIICCALVQQIRLQGAQSIKYAIKLIEKQIQPGEHITVQSILLPKNR